MRPALERVERLSAGGLHAVGYIAYEAGPAFDAAIAARTPGRLPLLQFALYRSSRTVPLPRAPSSSDAPAWRCEIDAAVHAHAIARIREAIAAGDVYQVNYTARFTAEWRGDALGLLLGMHARQRGGYTAWLDFGEHAIACASPELFVARRGDTAITRPMKGTAARGRWREEDDVRAAALIESPKERAENVMIVDLLRNDLGRLAVPGTVRVPRLFEAERYPTVWQLTSTIEATLRPGTTTTELLAALFPCGSVTGAPKIAATRMIASLEQSPRGVYCGTVGYIAPGGDATFAVAIRTATLDRVQGTIAYGAGGGITWDSAPTAEFDELLAKAAIATAPWTEFELLETLRLEEGTAVRLARHLARLRRSAAYFDIPLDPALAAAAVESAIRTAAVPGAAGRLRLLVSHRGEVRAELHPFDVQPGAPLLAVLAGDPVSSDDPFLHHKTTRREIYDARRRAHPEYAEVLLRNERGELTEFTTGNVVVELKTRRWTPPRECGLLPGVFREELLERGAIAERVLDADDLASASRVWLVNSLREWVPVTMAWPRP